MQGASLTRVAAIICVAIVASGVATALASGGAGGLDRSFGDRGKILTRFKHRSGHHGGGHPAAEPRANSVLIDSRNRVVAVGTAAQKFVLARYKRTGKLDRSFGGPGTVATPFTDYDGALSIAIDSRGRIVAGGFAKRDLALARYEPNGKLDPSFGDGGKVRANFPGLASA